MDNDTLEDVNIAIAVSEFNEKITKKLLEGTLAILADNDIDLDSVDICWVPGAFELPLCAQQFAQKDDYDAVICLGAVIRGETDHYTYVCEQASQGCMRVSLEHDIPVVFGVLTTENAEQATARSGGAKGNKGEDAAHAALNMIRLMRDFDNDDLGDDVDDDDDYEDEVEEDELDTIHA